MTPGGWEAGLVFELSYNQTAGHVFLPEEKLIQATATSCLWMPQRSRQDCGGWRRRSTQFRITWRD